MTFWKWSRTANNNATVDSTINWAEGQAPSSVNDSARAMMAAAAKYRDDVSGAIVTGGTSTAYTVTSLQGYSAVSDMAGAIIAFSPHVTNGATVTLNVDGLGAKPLRLSPNVELQTNTLITGTPYIALYNNGDTAWYLHGIGGNAYSIPLGGGLDYWGTTAPSSAFAFPAGQAISRTTYATLFSLISTTYGAGDTTTTFNLPDKTGRVSAMKEASASRLTVTYFGASSGQAGGTLGAVGGSEQQTLTLAQTPTGITAANAAQAISVTSNSAIYPANQAMTSNPGTGGAQQYPAGGSANNSIASSGNNSISVTSNNTGGAAHPIVQPTIVCNYIMRII